MIFSPPEVPQHNGYEDDPGVTSCLTLDKLLHQIIVASYERLFRLSYFF